MKVLHVISETPASFLKHVKDLTFIEKKPLRLVSVPSALATGIDSLSVGSVRNVSHRSCALWSWPI